MLPREMGAMRAAAMDAYWYPSAGWGERKSPRKVGATTYLVKRKCEGFGSERCSHRWRSAYLDLGVVIGISGEISERGLGEVLTQVIGDLLESAEITAVGCKWSFVVLVESFIHAQFVIRVVAPPRVSFELHANRGSEPHVINHILPDIRVVVEYRNIVCFECSFWSDPGYH